MLTRVGQQISWLMACSPWVIVACILFASSYAHGQNVMPAAPETDVGGLAILALAAAAVGGVIFIRRRDKKAFDAKVEPFLANVKHTIGEVKDGVSTKLHAFEAALPGKAQPAIAPTPTSVPMQSLAATVLKLEAQARETFPDGHVLVLPTPAPAAPAAALPEWARDTRTLKV